MQEHYRKMSKQPNTKKTVAFDFDWVIHLYDKGRQDWEIYWKCNHWVLEFIEKLMSLWYSVYIHSTRNPRQIKRRIKKQIWIEMETRPCDADGIPWTQTIYPYKIQVIWRWRKFRNKKNVLGISRRKIPAIIYIDDRWYKFEWMCQLIKDFYELYPPTPRNI